VSNPRAKTKEELREEFMDKVRLTVQYWQRETRSSKDDAISGVAFSILNIFDGTAMGICGFDIVARPHPDDKEFHKSEGENWTKDGTVINDDAALHEMFYEKK
jgi:hypothetical protein